MNTNEQKPVDVLAVMAAASLSIGKMGDIGKSRATKIDEARAAMAELVEADKALDAASRALAQTDPQSEDAETMESMRAHRNRCIARRAAALARVGGAA